jgi:hypothetical protein
MEESTENQKDKELRRMLREIPLEKPSPDFTANVMLGIREEAIQKSTTYQPPIPKGILVMIIALCCLAVAISVYMDPRPGINWFGLVQWDLKPTMAFLDKVAGLGMSKTLSYGALALAVAIFAQIYLLKGQLEKRFTVSG